MKDVLFPALVFDRSYLFMTTAICLNESTCVILFFYNIQKQKEDGDYLFGIYLERERERARERGICLHTRFSEGLNRKRTENTKDKQTNNARQNTTQIIKVQAKPIPLKIGGDLMCLGRMS